MSLFDADKSATRLPVPLITGLARLRQHRGEPGPVAAHGVHHVFYPPVLLAGWPDDARRSAIVFITRGVSRAEVGAGMPGAAA